MKYSALRYQYQVYNILEMIFSRSISIISITLFSNLHIPYSNEYKFLNVHFHCMHLKKEIPVYYLKKISYTYILVT